MQAWPFCSRLKSCDISGVNVSTLVLKSCGIALAENPSLTRVDISPYVSNDDDKTTRNEGTNDDNKGVGGGLVKFVEAIKNNTVLLTLNLGGYIKNPHSSQIAGAIQSVLTLNARVALIEGFNGVGGIVDNDVRRDNNGGDEYKSIDGIVVGNNNNNNENDNNNENNYKTTSNLNQGSNDNTVRARGDLVVKVDEIERNDNNASGIWAPPPTPVLNPFTSPPPAPLDEVQGEEDTITNTSTTGMTMKNNGNEPSVDAATLGSAIINQQLLHNQQLVTSDAIRAARASWESERISDLENVKNHCAETSHASLMTTETKLVEIVSKLNDELVNMKQSQADMVQQFAGMTSLLENKIDSISARVEGLETMQVSANQKNSKIIEALQIVDSKTTDSSYIQSFVQKQYDELRGDLKKQIKQELDEDHEKSITALEVNRHIDHARLDGKCSQLSERLENLRNMVVKEQEGVLRELQSVILSSSTSNAVTTGNDNVNVNANGTIQ